MKSTWVASGSVVAILLIAQVAFAQRTAKTPLISMNVDRQPLVVGEPFVFTIHIESSSSRDPEIKIPRFGGFRILQQSESHPVSFSFSFGLGSGGRRHSKKESNYKYVLVADKPGRYRLDPVVVVLDGTRFKGKPYTIDILKSDGTASTTPMPQNQPSPAISDGQANPGADSTDPGPTDLDGAKFDKTFFVQTKLSKKDAVIGEPIVMTIYLYTSVNIGGLEVIREPGTEGFWVENLLEGNRRFTTDPVRIGGREFGRGVLRKVVLYPIKPGKLTVAPALVELQTRRGGFFSRPKSVKRSALPASIDVSKLPPTDQPEGFNPANVGNFTFKATVDQTEIKVGEPVTLTLSVAGEGNIRNLKLPALDELDGFKVYAPESDSDVSVQGDRVIGTQKSRVLMIPNGEGEFIIPAIPWSYFDPQKKTYRTLRSQSQKIRVASSRTAAAPSSSAPAEVPTTIAGQDRLNRKLKSILSRSDLAAAGAYQTIYRPWFIALVVLAPLMYFAVVLVSRTRRRIAEGSLKGRSKRAHAVAASKLRELSKDPDRLSAEEFFAGLSKILTGFLEDRLETAVVGDTAMELRERLVSRGFDEGAAGQVVNEVEACDFARFAGASTSGDRKQALGRMAQLLRGLSHTKVLPKEEASP